MGLASTFVYLGYKYGDDNSKRITKEIIEEMMYHTIKKSNELVSTMGTFEHYDKSTFKDGKFYFKNEKYKDEIKDLLSSGVVNSRFMSIAPTGSISLLA
jgi:ribonucleotide reductase alpha subunit